MQQESRPHVRARPGQARGEPIELGPLATSTAFHLELASTAALHAFARAVAGTDVRPGRAAILLLIGRNPGISQTALSRAGGRDKSTLTPALNDLARRGLIRRTRTLHDRRSYQLTLTAAGEAMVRRLTECAARYDERLERIIGARDKRRLLQILRTITAALA